MRNFVYINTTTKRIKTSSHAVSDEAHYSQTNRPRDAQILMEHGYTEPITTDEYKLVNTRPPVKSVSSLTTEQPLKPNYFMYFLGM